MIRVKAFTHDLVTSFLSLTVPLINASWFLVCVSFVKSESSITNPVDWTVADVASYFTAAGFPEQALAFRMQVCTLHFITHKHLAPVCRHHYPLTPHKTSGQGIKYTQFQIGMTM